ncbi:caspase-12-like [Trichosurus vulpecula]|uniref:caspase-12-like n=1 Tax=Trichosurus vulpecula TaxID=9337 RepID=UPI00186ACF61|nr:caspase-12-like [Trichosurus vulpecula]
MAEQKKNDDPVKNVMNEATKMFKNIFDDLIEQNVFNPNQIRNMEKEFSSVIRRSEDLVKTVTHKSGLVGQIVLKNFSTATRALHSGIQVEDENLEPIENAGISQAVASLLLEPRAIQAAESLNKVKLSSTNFYQELKEAKDEEIYAVMEKENRTRLALIISNSKFDHLNERNEARFDIQRMLELLQDLGYRVDVKENCTSLEMKSVLEEFADLPEHQSSDSTFLVFMSHGTKDGIFGIKHKQEEPDILANDTIFEIFNSSNCWRLIHKPKVIIIHGCEVGIVSEQGAAAASEGSCVQSSKDDKNTFCKDATRKEHVEKDFICFRSTTPYDISLEDDQDGSRFISLLIDCFQQYSWCCHVEEVFKKVQKSFETSQDPVPLPTIERLSMTRYFYLFPGI